MTLSTSASAHGSLVRDVSGEHLRGFARDFIRESIRANLKYPQTQAIIRLAVARSILDASTRGCEGEVLDLYRDLQHPQPTSIDLRGISRFVHKHYRALKLSIPEIPCEAYARLFGFEIEQGLRTIGSLCLSTPSRCGADADTHERLTSLAEAPQRPHGSFDIAGWCDCVKALRYEHKVALRDCLDAELQALYRNPRQRILHDFLVQGLQREPQEKWQLNVLFPYVATVTKMGMAAEVRVLEGLKMPPISESSRP